MSSPMDAGKISALLIDDDPLVRHFLGAYLTHHGFRITAVHDGLAGFEAAVASPPDLIILDHGMAGMDGTEVAMRLKANDATKDIPLILLSGDELTPEEQKRLADIGVDEYVRKGVDMEALMRRISAVLQKHGERRYAAPEPLPEPGGLVKALDVRGSRGAFFRILGGTAYSQVGSMTIPPGGDSGPEDLHPGDQIIYVIAGRATVEVGDERIEVPEGHACIIPERSRHHIYNRGKEELFFLTCYAPPAY